MAHNVVPVLLDFESVAKMNEHGMCRGRSGTPGYQAPEVRSGEWEYDATIDLFSLGKCLGEWLIDYGTTSMLLALGRAWTSVFPVHRGKVNWAIRNMRRAFRDLYGRLPWESADIDARTPVDNLDYYDDDEKASERVADNDGVSMPSIWVLKIDKQGERGANEHNVQAEEKRHDGAPEEEEESSEASAESEEGASEDEPSASQVREKDGSECVATSVMREVANRLATATTSIDMASFVLADLASTPGCARVRVSDGGIGACVQVSCGQPAAVPEETVASSATGSPDSPESVDPRGKASPSSSLSSQSSSSEAEGVALQEPASVTDKALPSTMQQSLAREAAISDPARAASKSASGHMITTV